MPVVFYLSEISTRNVFSTGMFCTWKLILIEINFDNHFHDLSFHFEAFVIKETDIIS